MVGQTFRESGVDRTIGTLLLGLLVSGFFILVIMGMQTVQNGAKSISGPTLIHDPDEKEEPVFDFPN